MIVLEIGDKIQGVASVNSVVDFSLSGLDNNTLSLLSTGQISSSLADLYTADSVDVVKTLTFVNTHSDVVYLNLYVLPFEGVARRILAKDLKLSIGTAIHTDGEIFSLVHPVEESFLASVDDTPYDATTWNGNTDAATKNAIRDKIETLASGHDAVTIDTANGLSLSTQVLSLAAATNSIPGAATAAQITAIEANTGKTTNATHTGDVTGDVILTLDKTAITGQTTVTADNADYVVISDTSDTGALKKALVSDFGGIAISSFTQDSGILVGTGAGTFQEETGATLRTSLNVDVSGTDNSTDVTLHASATTGGLSLSTQEISSRAASNALTGYATAAQITALELATNIENYANSPMVITGGEITTLGAAAGTFDVSAITALVRSTDSYTGALVYITLGDQSDVTISLANTTYFVFLDYNGGAPQINLDTTNVYEAGTDRTQLPIGKVMKDGSDVVHYISGGYNFQDGVRKLQRRIRDLHNLTLASGSTIEYQATNQFTMTQAVIYAGVNKFTIANYDSNATDFIHFYSAGGGNFTYTAATDTIDFANYDAGAGSLDSVSNAKFGCFWVYVHIDGHAYVRYGECNGSLAEAEASLEPSKPIHLADFGILVGKFIMPAAGGSFSLVQMVTDTQFTAVSAADHANLTSLAYANSGHTGFATDDNTTDVTLSASATTGGMSLSGQEISNRSATNALTGYATAAHITAIETNTDKVSLEDNSVTLAKMAGGTDGNLITYDAAGDPAYVATGTVGQVLTSAGAGAAPTMQDAGGISDVVNDTTPTLGGPLDADDKIISKAVMKDTGETINVLGDLGGGTDDIDLEDGNVVTATVSTAEQTFTFSNPPASGTNGSFTLILTNGGSQTVNWPASVDWVDATAPTLTAAGVDVLVFTTIDAGTIYLGFTAGLDVS